MHEVNEIHIHLAECDSKPCPDPPYEVKDIANPTVLCRQVNDLLLRLQHSTGSRLHLSIVIFDWFKEPRELY